jgi:hypothetical protein
MRRFLFLVMVIIPCVVWGQTLVSEPVFGGGLISTGTLSFTRPSNVTTYAANDAVSQGTTVMLRFPVGKKAGYLTNMSMMVDTANGTNAQFRLWLFLDSANVTKAADNAAFALLAGVTNIQNIIGYIDFNLSTEGTGSTGAFAQVDGIGKAFVVGNAREFYGLLEAKAAWVPGNGATFRIKYRLIQ